jgi:hypothetical protein
MGFGQKGEPLEPNCPLMRREYAPPMRIAG